LSKKWGSCSYKKKCTLNTYMADLVLYGVDCTTCCSWSIFTY